MDIEGKHALVTGGSAGIGFAITRALARAGATVLIVGRDKAKLEAARRLSPSIMSFAADLSDPGERQRVIDYVSDTALPLDILINNAGTMQCFDLTADDAVVRIDREVALDLQAPVHLAIALLPRLLERPEAAIVNVTTGLAYAPRGATPGYSIAKDGLRAFTRSMREQLRDTKVQIVELMPLAVETDLSAHFDGPKANPYVVATALLDGLRDGRAEVRPGMRRRRGIVQVVPSFITRVLGSSARTASHG